MEIKMAVRLCEGCGCGWTKDISVPWVVGAGLSSSLFLISHHSVNKTHASPMLTIWKEGN